jgi:hypothetical protein
VWLRPGSCGELERRREGTVKVLKTVKSRENIPLEVERRMARLPAARWHQWLAYPGGGSSLT